MSKFKNESNGSFGYHFDLTKRISVRIGVNPWWYLRDVVQNKSWKNNKLIRCLDLPHHEWKIQKSGRCFQFAILNVSINVRRWYK